MIEFSKVFYSYNDIQALDDISFKICDGESAAFIGPNGSGKSTLMRIINGLIFPNKGSYLFNGDNINSKRLQDNKFSKAFHKQIGFVFQNSDVQLFCSSVYDEIAFGVRQMGFDEKETDKRVYDVLNLLGIENLKARQPYHLSGGEKKKVAIASVLALNPDVIVLDEPMGGLDPKTKRFVRELMISLNKCGKTIICSTHDFEYVKGIFKRAIVLSSQHKIIRDGNYDDILSDKKFLYDNNII